MLHFINSEKRIRNWIRYGGTGFNTVHGGFGMHVLLRLLPILFDLVCYFSDLFTSRRVGVDCIMRYGFYMHSWTEHRGILTCILILFLRSFSGGY